MRLPLETLECYPGRRMAAYGVRLGLAVVLLTGVVFVFRGCLRSRKPKIEPEVPVEMVEIMPPPSFVFPTAQDRLDATHDPSVYMPTASGRVESALYGSTRTSGANRNFSPRFHGGIDIAPMARDGRGKPLDAILAVADGQVAYVHTVAGGSSYGRYVVLFHDDPMGAVYSLYAHLAQVADDVKTGLRVGAGFVLGRMGHSASTPIPVQRAHLHLEIGVIMNERFEAWLRHNGMPVTHGVGHGWNLFGVDPLRVLLARDAAGCRSMLDVLRTEPSAYVLALRLDSIPDYYHRYPDLWDVDDPLPLVVRIDVSEGAVPLRARPLPESPPETTSAEARVLTVYPEVLGRNGRGMIRQRNGNWELTAAGHRWIDMLLF